MTDRALIFDIKRGCSEDGPGIRTSVFFKGCPLACVWCQNPEGIAAQTEQTASGESIGEWLELDELLYRLRVDLPFYRSSGGGVTLSGGEPTRQMQFAGRLLRALKADGVHTAIETCGLFPLQAFCEQLLPWLDLIYFDLKLADNDSSRKYTGRSNRTILANFRQLQANAEIPIIPRIPLIPGITDSAGNLSAIARFLRENGVDDCRLMPYNPTWQDKLQRLGKPATYQHAQFLSREEQCRCAQYFQHSATEGGPHAD